MKLQLKLNTRMMLFIVATSTVIYGISIGYISLNLKRQTYLNSISYANNSALKYSGEVKTILDEYVVTARNLQYIFQNYSSVPEKERRPLLRETIVKILEQNNDLISIWTIWEPNSIDNLDGFYKNTPGNTYIGNFSPTYYKNKNQILLQENNSVNLFQDEYYTIPKRTLKETFLNPFYYSYTSNKSDEILQASIVEPIVSSGKFQGVIGVDIPLRNFNTMIQKIKPFNTGYSFLVANNGVFVAHPDTTFILKPLSNYYMSVVDTGMMLSQIQQGKKMSFSGTDPYLKQKCIISFAPISIGETNTPWSLAIVVPHSTLIETSNKNFYFNIFIGIGGLILLTLIIAFISKSITRPIIRTTAILQDMAKGEIGLERLIEVKTTDEIGELNQAINDLITNLSLTIDFAKKIGDDQLDAEYTALGDEDILGQSLLEMRENLIRARKLEQEKRIEDDKRNWVTQGLAKFGEILREHSDSIEGLSNSVVQHLAEYIDAAQCGIFVINDDNPEDIFYDLVSVVAFGRKKLYESRIYNKEGLIGRAADEKITIYLPQSPADYVYISQGLSTAGNPRSVLIVPLNLNDYIYGVLELISYKPFEPYQIEFVEKLGESIASTIASIKVNQRTERLLSQSRKLEDELAQQEEEMRQNLEEMQATQEETAKREAELRSILSAINAVTLVAELDVDGTVLKINEKLAQAYGSTVELMTGKPIEEFIAKSEQQLSQMKQIFDAVHEGMQQKYIRHLQFHSKETWLEEHYSPVMDMDDVRRIILIAIDITEEKLLDRQSQQLEEEIKQLENELRNR